LPVAYRHVVEVVADAGPLRAKQVCQALRLPTEPRRREGMRIKLKRLVERGWLVEASPGAARQALAEPQEQSGKCPAANLGRLTAPGSVAWTTGARDRPGCSECGAIWCTGREVMR
jgi:hypothetical protein